MALSSFLLYPSHHLYFLSVMISIRSLNVSTMVPPRHPEHNLLSNLLLDCLYSSSSSVVLTLSAFPLVSLPLQSAPPLLSSLTTATATWLFCPFLFPCEWSALSYHLRLLKFYFHSRSFHLNLFISSFQQ